MEEATCTRAGVCEAEAVSTQGCEVVRNELADLVGNLRSEVGGRDDRASSACQLLGHVRNASGLVRVQQSLFLSGNAVAAQLSPRGDGPDVCGDAPVLSQQLLSLLSPRNSDTRSEQLCLGAGGQRGLADLVDTLDDALNVNVCRLSRLVNRLVVHGQVVHDVVIFVLGAVHLLDTALHDVGNLVGVGRVVDLERRVGGRQDRGVAVVVLQALTGQGGTTGGCTDDEAAAHLVGCCPEAVAGALETEHRVEDVNRDHRLAVGVVGGTDSGERCGCTCLVNTNVNDLALGGLGVGEHELVVNGHVVLAVGVVQLSRGEECFHTEGTCLIGGDGSDTVTEALHTHEVLH